MDGAPSAPTIVGFFQCPELSFILVVPMVGKSPEHIEINIKPEHSWRNLFLRILNRATLPVPSVLPPCGHSVAEPATVVTAPARLILRMLRLPA